MCILLCRTYKEAYKSIDAQEAEIKKRTREVEEEMHRRGNKKLPRADHQELCSGLLSALLESQRVLVEQRSQLRRLEGRALLSLMICTVIMTA